MAIRFVLPALLVLVLVPAAPAAQEEVPEAEPTSDAARAPDQAPAPVEAPEAGACASAVPGAGLPAPVPMAIYPQCDDVSITTPCSKCPEACYRYGILYPCSCQDYGPLGELCECAG